MSASDTSVLESLKIARDAVVAALATGESVVEYTIRNRTVRREASTILLRELEALIQTYEKKVGRAAGMFTVARLQRATRIDSD